MVILIDKHLLFNVGNGRPYYLCNKAKGWRHNEVLAVFWVEGSQDCGRSFVLKGSYKTRIILTHTCKLSNALANIYSVFTVKGLHSMILIFWPWHLYRNHYYNLITGWWLLYSCGFISAWFDVCFCKISCHDLYLGDQFSHWCSSMSL